MGDAALASQQVGRGQTAPRDAMHRSLGKGAKPPLHPPSEQPKATERNTAGAAVNDTAAQHCSGCGAVVKSPQARFCTKCGFVLAGAQIAAASGTRAHRNIAATRPRANAASAKPKRRSGSENRHRTRKIDVRCDDEQFAVIQDKAHGAGLSRSAYALAAMLDAKPPRRRRVPAMNAEAMNLFAQGITAINRANNNANQIARELNQQKFKPDGGLLVRARNGDSGAVLAIEAMQRVLETATAEFKTGIHAIARAAGYEDVHRR